MRGDVATVRLEAETPAARNLLLDHLATLRDRLAEQNVKVSRLDVDLMGGDAGGHYQTPSRDRRPDAPPPGNSVPTAAKAPPPAVGRSRVETATIGDGSLNVVV
jgi:hypothetical protein